MNRRQRKRTAPRRCTLRVYADRMHFGLGLIRESTPGATQWTLHFAWFYIKLTFYRSSNYTAARLAQAAYYSNRISQLLKDKDVRLLAKRKQIDIEQFEEGTGEQGQAKKVHRQRKGGDGRPKGRNRQPD